MDDDDGSNNGGTGKLGPKPSLDTVVCQTPTQPEVPLWMLARNNSVHAPVFGQPSEPKSTSLKLPRMPSFAFGSKGSESPWAEIQAAVTTNNANGQANVAHPSPKPPPSVVALDKLNDDQALALLLKNETVARMLQNAFNTRVEEHQQKLERAYNRRLVELEDYTRSWRETTKELWSAVSEGRFDTNESQQASLSWEGPQEAGSNFNPEHTTASREIVEKEFDSDGRVACIRIKNPSASPSTSHFNLVNWTNGNGSGSKDFRAFAHKIPQFVKNYPHRIVFREMNRSGEVKYRAMTSVESTIQNINSSDVFVELTSSNVELMGKAFCYLQDTKRRVVPTLNIDNGGGVSAAELAFLYDRFSQEPTKLHMDVVSLFNRKGKVFSDLFAANIDADVIARRLLIARPCYTINGGISGASFFDVGSGAYTKRQKSDFDIILFEDRVAFTRLALLLCFCINQGIVPLSLGKTSSAPNLNNILSENGFESADSRNDHGAFPSSEDIAPTLAEFGMQEWITDIKGSTTDFVCPGSKLLLLMSSPYLPGHEFSTFLEATPPCGRIIFRQRNSSHKFSFFTWKGYKNKISPEVMPQDIVVDFSIQNILLLWKAFCALKDRHNYLLSKMTGPLSEISMKACDELYEKLDQHYRESFPLEKRATLVRSLSLPMKASPGGGVYDGKAEGKPLDRRLLIARPCHQGKQVIGAEFFDIGSGARTGRVSNDLVIIEDSVMLKDIGSLLEQTVLMNIFPVINQALTTAEPRPIELPKSKSGVLPPISQAGEPEQSGKVFSVVRNPFANGNTLHNAGLEHENGTPVSITLTPPQPSLFQRTLALSDGLKELRDESQRGQSNPQAPSQWLAVGGEPHDVHSPPPKLEQDRIADNRSQAYGVEEEVLPFGTTNQHSHDDSSDGTENSDLMMFEEKPKNVAFQFRKKRPHDTAFQGGEITKKPKLFIAEPSSVSEEQLPLGGPHDQAAQCLPTLPLGSFTRTEEHEKEYLDESTANSTQSQDDTEYKEPHTIGCSERQVLPSTIPRPQSVPLADQNHDVAFSPPPFPSNTIVRRTQELREQLRQLGCRFEDNDDQVGDRTVGGNIENSGQLKADEALRQPPTLNEMTSSHQLREKLKQLGCRFEEKVNENTLRMTDGEVEHLQASFKLFEDMLESLGRIEERQKDEEKLHPGAQLPSLAVPNQAKALSSDSDLLFTKQQCATDNQKILTGQCESTCMDGEGLDKCL